MVTTQNLSEVVSRSKLPLVSIPKQLAQTITRAEFILYPKGRLQRLEGQVERQLATVFNLGDE